MKISGIVKDYQNQPLMGANIIPLRNGKGFGVGIETSIDGEFTLESNEIEPDTNIKISYLGFKPQIIKAKDVQDAKITLEESFEELDEVVITATKKKDVPVEKRFNEKAILIMGSGVVIALLALIIYKKQTS